jgi:aromatic ring-opening dioxygenase catalytic subunit (LigB family)
MADVVLGIGSSHSPQLSSTAEMWSDHARRDRSNRHLLGPDGEFHTFEEMASLRDVSAAELTAHTWSLKYDRAQACIQILSKHLQSTSPDVVVIVGDDQRELYDESCNPAIALCLADELWDGPPTSSEHDKRFEEFPGLKAAQWAMHGSEPSQYPVARELSEHLAEHLMSSQFDLAVLSSQKPSQRLGHAFTFCRYRLGLPPETPIVPVMLNTIYSPNVPSPGRCYDLGRALRRAIDDFPGALRVAIVASGGLSHFVVLEEWDQQVIDAIRKHDAETLASIPRRYFRTGTSEVLNWVTVAGAFEDTDMKLVDYIPAYRSIAGTGTGLAFALWEGH